MKRIGWLFCCIGLLLSCGVKRESRMRSVAMLADSLHIRYGDSLRLGGRVYHAFGRAVEWEEVTLSAPDSMQRQHVRRIRRGRMSDSAFVQTADTLAAGRQYDEGGRRTTVATAEEERHSETRPALLRALLYPGIVLLLLFFLVRKVRRS